MEAVLVNVRNEIQLAAERKESVNNVLKHVYDSIRLLQAKLLRIQMVAAPVLLRGEVDEVKVLQEQVVEGFGEMKMHWKKVEEILGNGQLLERNRYIWKNAVQQIVALAAFVFWIERQELVEKEVVEQWTGCINFIWEIC